MKEGIVEYRSDVDGLRAIAVLSVVVFHIEAQLLPGGFVGVDVFFVISGYLITKIITHELATSRFSVSRFYERRARRILPALFGVLLFSTTIAFVYLLPGELISYAKSLLAVVGFASNLYFWQTADYFDTAAASKPLLNTWSLSVEEQFYLFYPLILIGILRSKLKLNFTIVGLLIVSFTWSVWSSYHNEVMAFYSPASRAWELLLGATVALGVIRRPKNYLVREGLALLGLLLIAFACFRFTSGTMFPGYAALLPCVGAALVIALGEDAPTLAGRLLSLMPMVFIGRISYSVYLWHWPLIVFFGMGFWSKPPKMLADPMLLLLSLGVGALSWWFVERPLRSISPRTRSSVPALRTAAFALLTCASIAIVLIRNEGFPSRFPNQAVAIADIMDDPQEMRIGSCFITTKYHFSDFQKKRCMAIAPVKRNYLLVGDSHAAALWYGISKNLGSAHVLEATASGCAPQIDSTGSNDCRALMNYVFHDFLQSKHVDAVLLSARWRHERQFEQLAKTVAWCRLHDIRVVILGPVMEYDAPLPRLLAYSVAYRSPDFVRDHQQSWMVQENQEMERRAVGAWHVPFLSLMDIQCPHECLRYADKSNDVALMPDDNHLSNAGSSMIVGKLLRSGELATAGIF